MASTKEEKKKEIKDLKDLLDKSGLLEDQGDEQKGERVVIKVIKTEPCVPPSLVIR